PDDDRGDLDRVAAFVIDLEFFAVEVPGAQRNLTARAAVKGHALRGRSLDCFRSAAAWDQWSPGARPRVKRVRPPEPAGAHRSLIGAEENQDARFIRLQGEMPAKKDDRQYLQQDRGNQLP